MFQYLFPLQLSEEACARNMLQSSIKHSITSVSLQGAAVLHSPDERLDTDTEVTHRLPMFAVQIAAVAHCIVCSLQLNTGQWN